MPPDVPSSPPVRRSARVLLIDAADRVLLFRVIADDPHAGGVWFAPGGGVELGETVRTAAARELAEETGLAVADDQLTGPVWVRRHVGANVDSRETYFTLRVDRHEVDTSGFTELEVRVLDRHRWWSVPELAEATDQVFAPRRIASMLPTVLTGSWSGPPLEVGG